MKKLILLAVVMASLSAKGQTFKSTRGKYDNNNVVPITTTGRISLSENFNKPIFTLTVSNDLIIYGGQLDTTTLVLKLNGDIIMGGIKIMRDTLVTNRIRKTMIKLLQK